jgi:hypothetical protein
VNFLQGPRNLKRTTVAGEAIDRRLLPSDPQLLLKLARGLWIVPAEGDDAGASIPTPAAGAVGDEKDQLLSAMFASAIIGVGVFDS